MIPFSEALDKVRTLLATERKELNTFCDDIQKRMDKVLGVENETTKEDFKTGEKEQQV